MEELRKQCMTWLERTNPLRGLSLSRASSIYDMARVYGSPRLQYMYNEIELTDPVLLVCADRRESALAGLEWSFVPRANADQTLAQEQADALGRFTDEIDNFGELLRHLDSAFFRGFAHAQPIWDGKLVAHVSLLDSWNFLTDRDGNWYWNPRCHETPSGLETVEDARLVSLAHRRSIDYPALFIYIRKALGERDYGRFIERHGIPHAAVIMAPGTEEKDKPQYLAAANAWNNGQDIVLPNAAGINLATEARGTDPFTPFIDHQDHGIVLLATGGTLTSLAQADTGSLAGGAQMEVWREIVARDGVAVADALNRHLFRRYLELEFPGRPMAAKFTLSNEKKPTAGEIADLAVKIKSAGYTVDQAQLEEKTGLKLVKDETPAPQPGMGAPFMNKELKVESGKLKVENSQLSTPNSQLLTAFAKDTGPAADAVKALLKTIESGGDAKAEAEALIEKLPDLMPEDPAMSAVIAEAMAAEFAEVASHPSQKSHPSQEQLEANKEDPARGETKEGTNSGSFAPAGDGNVSAKNDGKIDFKGRLTSKSKADDQCKKFGYSSVDDMMMQSVNVSTERIDEILNGGDFTCKPHEAVAALRSLRTIQPNVRGEKPVKVGEHSLRHYVCGERRHHGGEPDIGRLTDFPRAVAAIRQCDVRTWQIDNRPTVVFPGEKPEKGTETVYAKKFGTEKAKVFAYTDSGVLTGWWVEK